MTSVMTSQNGMQKEKWKGNLEVKIIKHGGVMVSTGVVEAVAASSGPRGTLKSWKLKFKRRR